MAENYFLKKYGPAPAPKTVGPGVLVPVPKEPPPERPDDIARKVAAEQRARDAAARDAALFADRNKPKPKDGFMFVDPTDPSKGQKQIPIIKSAEENPAKALALDETLSAISRARGQIGGWTTGLGGSIMGRIPGTEATDLRSTINTVASQVTQGVLAELKSQSPTGASGFGALSEREGQLLRDAVASLDTSQSQDQLRHNLDQVELHFRRLKAINAGDDPTQPDVQQKYGITPLLGGATGGTTGGGTPDIGPAKGYRFDNNAIGALNAYLKTPGASAEGLKAMHDQLSGGAALMTPEDAAALFKQGRIEGFDYSKIDAPVEAQARALAAEQDAKAASVGAPRTDAGTLVNEGFTFGLSGEAAGVGNALSGLTRGDTNLIPNYLVGRNARDLQIADARRNLGYTGTALELGGGLLSGGVGLARAYAPSANIASSNMRAAVGGGALAGFGYGQDEGSVTGAALGAGLGYGLAKATPVVGSALAGVYDRVANRPSAVAARNARAGLQAEGAALQQAGQAEGVNVNRAMVDPNVESQVTRTQASLFGGNRVTRDMGTVSGQIETGIGRLGDGGTKLENEVAGQSIQTAAERYIKQSGAVASRQYTKAERLAGNIRVPPNNAVATLDRHILELEESPLGAPKALTDLRDKLSGGKQFTVKGLRFLRTSMRDEFRTQNLTGTDIERRAMDAIDALSTDIEIGLAAAGKTDAVKAFKAADGAYRQRMSFINDTVQKLIGKRNANVTAEETLKKFKAMATPGGDEAGLGKMMAQMEPDEAANIRATLAYALGRNKKDEFSPLIFTTNAGQLPQAARVHIFGQEGAESIARLTALAKAANRVTSQFNAPKTAVARAADIYKASIMTVAGLGGGAGTGSTMTGLATAGVAGSAMAARDVLSARALMSTNLTKWLARTPTTSADINKHIQQLGVVASRDPAIANEVLSLQARLIESINSAPARLAADEGNPRRNVINGRQGNGQNNGGTDQGSSRQAPPNTGAPR